MLQVLVKYNTFSYKHNIWYYTVVECNKVHLLKECAKYNFEVFELYLIISTSLHFSGHILF